MTVKKKKTLTCDFRLFFKYDRYLCTKACIKFSDLNVENFNFYYPKTTKKCKIFKYFYSPKKGWKTFKTAHNMYYTKVCNV